MTDARSERSLRSRRSELGARIEVVKLSPGKHALTIACFDEEIVSRFREMGCEGNGYTWCGLVESAARILFGQQAETLSHSPTADSAMATSEDPAPLEIIAAHLRSAFHDDQKMAELIENANPEFLE